MNATTTINEAEQLVRYSRRGLWVALILIMSTGAHPLLAFAPTWIAVAQPAAVMACLTIITGMAAVFESMPYVDR